MESSQTLCRIKERNKQFADSSELFREVKRLAEGGDAELHKQNVNKADLPGIHSL